MQRKKRYRKQQHAGQQRLKTGRTRLSSKEGVCQRRADQYDREKEAQVDPHQKRCRYEQGSYQDPDQSQTRAPLRQSKRFQDRHQISYTKKREIIPELYPWYQDQDHSNQ